MLPVFFPEHNAVLTGPGGVGDEDILPLPVLRDGVGCWSMWEPDAAERTALLAGGCVLIGVMSGTTMPPICVCVSPKPESPEGQTDAQPTEGAAETEAEAPAAE